MIDTKIRKLSSRKRRIVLFVVGYAVLCVAVLRLAAHTPYLSFAVLGLSTFASAMCLAFQVRAKRKANRH